MTTTTYDITPTCGHTITVESAKTDAGKIPGRSQIRCPECTEANGRLTRPVVQKVVVKGVTVDGVAADTTVTIPGAPVATSTPATRAASATARDRAAEAADAPPVCSGGPYPVNADDPGEGDDIRHTVPCAAHPAAAVTDGIVVDPDPTDAVVPDASVDGVADVTTPEPAQPATTGTITDTGVNPGKPEHGIGRSLKDIIVHAVDQLPGNDDAAVTLNEIHKVYGVSLGALNLRWAADNNPGARAVSVPGGRNGTRKAFTRRALATTS